MVSAHFTGLVGNFQEHFGLSIYSPQKYMSNLNTQTYNLLEVLLCPLSHVLSFILTTIRKVFLSPLYR